MYGQFLSRAAQLTTVSAKAIDIHVLKPRTESWISWAEPIRQIVLGDVRGQVKATRIFQACAVTQNGYSDWSDSMTRVVM